MQYYLFYNDKVIGPMTPQQIMQYEVNENSQISVDGGAWQPLLQFPELMTLLNQKKTVITKKQVEDSSSKKIASGICAILFGQLGIQYFILGKIGAGFAVIGITVAIYILTCGMGVYLYPLFFVAQGIYMLTLSDEKFYDKFINTNSFMPLF